MQLHVITARKVAHNLIKIKLTEITLTFENSFISTYFVSIVIV